MKPLTEIDTCFSYRNVDSLSAINNPAQLCATLSSKIAQAYAKYCKEHHDKELYFTIDEVTLQGEPVSVSGSAIKKPIRLYVHCRLTKTYEGIDIPIMEILRDTVDHFFDEIAALSPKDQ